MHHRRRKLSSFRIELSVLAPEDGGRRKPIFSEYRSCWDIGNLHEGETMYNDVPLVLEGGLESASPGDRATARIHPIAPEYWNELRPGTTIYAHEGSRRVATAVVLEVVPPETPHSDSSPPAL